MVAPPLLTDLYHPDHLYQTVLPHDAACREIDAKTSGSATFTQQFRSKSANLGPPPYLFATASDGLGGQRISSIRTGRMLGTPPRPQVVVVGRFCSIIASSLPPAGRSGFARFGWFIRIALRPWWSPRRRRQSRGWEKMDYVSRNGE